jgi:hypothetical protein
VSARVRYRATVAVAMLALTGCVHTAFDQHLRAGEWQSAVDAFARDSTLQRDPSALRRAAYLHAHPESTTWNPTRAASLLALAGRGDPRLHDLRLQRVLLQFAIADEARAAVAEDLRDQMRLAQQFAEALRAELDSVAVRAASQDEERALLHRLVVRLEADLRAREAEINTLRGELERLKAIDLGVPGRPPTAP